MLLPAWPSLNLTRRPNTAAPRRAEPTLQSLGEVELTPLPAAYLQAANTHNRVLLRDSELLRSFAPSTPAMFHDRRAFRRRVGEVQLQLARAAYKDTPGAMLLSARVSPTAKQDSLAEARMATNAGQALVRLTPQGLITMGLTQDMACAAEVLRVLRRANILDGNNQVSRGDHRDVAPNEVAGAVAPMRLTPRQHAMVQDIVIVAKFLYDFGICEARSALDLELCCGATTFARRSSWREWGAFVTSPFDPDANSQYNKRLRARLIELSCPVQI